MNDGKLMTIPVFCDRNAISKSAYHYLKRLGRSPKEIYIGTKVVISPDAEDEWRREMQANPIKRGQLRKQVLDRELVDS